MTIASLIISSTALLISLITFWLTKIKRGIVKMTRPTIICFVSKNGTDDPKVFLRTLIYSTSEREQYIQNMYIQLQNDTLQKKFSIWAYGDKGIVRGSGLFVNKSGFDSYHHFLLSKTDSNYHFVPGIYTIKVFVETINSRISKIFEHKLIVDQERLQIPEAIYFDWDVDKQNYSQHQDIKTGLSILI